MYLQFLELYLKEIKDKASPDSYCFILPSLPRYKEASLPHQGTEQEPEVDFRVVQVQPSSLLRGCNKL